MKRLLIILLVVVMFVPNFAYAEENLATNAKSAVLMEASTGKILFEKNKDDRVAVASLTKMMSQILILEAVEAGNLKWDEKITASANAAGYGGTQIYLEPGEVMTTKELMKGISMASANDATVALAERIAGTEEKFVDMMNKKAKEFGLKNTNFVNPTGLDEDNHYSSAYDLAIIAKKLMKHEEIFEFSSLYEDYLRQNTPNKFWLVNTNKLVRLYEGCDGLKTGFTDAAGYTMAVTAKRGNERLIAIVLGEEVSKVRNKETTELLDYGFNTYKVKLLMKKGEIIDKININKGSKKSINGILKDDITILMNKSDSDKEYTQKVKIDDIKLPIKKNDKIGSIVIYDNDKKVGEYDIVSDSDVSKKNIFNVFMENLGNLVSGNLKF